MSFLADKLYAPYNSEISESEIHSTASKTSLSQYLEENDRKFFSTIIQHFWTDLLPDHT